MPSTTAWSTIEYSTDVPAYLRVPFVRLTKKGSPPFSGTDVGREYEGLRCRVMTVLNTNLEVEHTFLDTLALSPVV